MTSFGCCLGILTLLFGGLGAFLFRTFGPRPKAQTDLIRLMTDFLYGVDQSQARVTQIHSLLLSYFLHDDQYQELMTAVASFAPGGAAPFLDEAGLSEAFRVFLRKRHIAVPEARADEAGVWPPPPRY